MRKEVFGLSRNIAICERNFPESASMLISHF